MAVHEAFQGLSKTRFGVKLGHGFFEWLVVKRYTLANVRQSIKIQYCNDLLL